MLRAAVLLSAIAALELWAVEPDAPLPVWQQEAEDQGGVMGAKHKQTREFMSMAGRELPSESAAAQRGHRPSSASTRRRRSSSTCCRS